MLPESNVGNTPTTNASRPAPTRAVSSAKACCVGVGQCTRLNLVSKSSYDARSSFSKTDMEGEIVPRLVWSYAPSENFPTLKNKHNKQTNNEGDKQGNAL